MSGSTRLSLLLLLLGCACSSEPGLQYSPAPWPQTHTAVLVPLDEDGALVQDPTVYSPGEPVQFELTDRVVRLVVQSYQDSAGDLVRCGVTSGGSLPRLPMPDATYLATELRSAMPFALEPVSDGLDFGLRYARCAPPPPSCPTATLVELPSDIVLDTAIRAMAVYRGALYMSAGGGGGRQLYRLEGARFVPVALPEPVGQRNAGFRTLAAAGDELWATQGDSMYRLGPDFSVLTSTRAPFSVRRVTVEGNGGPVIATTDDDGVGGVFDATGQTPAMTVPANGAVLEGEDHRYLLAGRAVHRWQSGAWSIERELEAEEGFSALGGDHEVVAGADGFGNILVRTMDGRWTSHAAAEGSRKLEVILHLGGGRIFFAGRRGLGLLWTGERWCPVADRGFANDFAAGVIFEGDVYLSTDDIDSVFGDRAMVFRLDWSNP